MGEHVLGDLPVDALGVLGSDLGDAHHLDRQPLDQLVGQVTEDGRGTLQSERDAEDRGLLARRDPARRRRGRHSFIHAAT